MDHNDKVAAAMRHAPTAGGALAAGPAERRDVSRTASAVQAEAIEEERRAPRSSAKDEAGGDQESPDTGEEGEGGGAKRAKKRGRKQNNVRKIRIERMMSKAELARRANLSVLTIDRVEKGFDCRMDTKRKILEALGLSLADRVRVFGEED
jgi:DNA-binding XRE family transcriptional regulator